MDRLKIERRGGFAGLKAGAEIDIDGLPEADRQAIEALFAARQPFAPAPGADRFEYVMTRETGAGARQVTVPEHLIPPFVRRAVKDRLPGD